MSKAVALAHWNEITFLITYFIPFNSICQDKEQYISKLQSAHMSLGEYYETNEAHFNNFSHVLKGGRSNILTTEELIQGKKMALSVLQGLYDHFMEISGPWDLIIFLICHSSGMTVLMNLL